MAILEPDQMRKVLQSALDDTGEAHAADFSATARVKYQLLKIHSGLSEWAGAEVGSWTQIRYYISMHNVLRKSVNLTCSQHTKGINSATLLSISSSL